MGYVLDYLNKLHDEILKAVYIGIKEKKVDLSVPVEHDNEVLYGDVSFGIDLISEKLILQYFKQNPFKDGCRVVSEGIGIMDFPTSDGKIKNTIIIDPIDGTREIMFDKRSAWILTGFAPMVDGACLNDITVALQTEIPVNKQHYFSRLWAIRGSGAYEQIFDINSLEPISPPQNLIVTKELTFEQGFVSFVNVFPGHKALISGIEDAFYRDSIGRIEGNDAKIFGDQYLATGGQIFLLAKSIYRLVVDIRGLVGKRFLNIEESIGLCCHPYDICTALIAIEAGAIISKLDGSILRAPLDTDTNVDWVGFGNVHLANKYIESLQKACNLKK